MKILAFDQSSKLSGWSLFEDNKYSCSGVIDKSKIKDSDRRIGEMGLEICEKIQELKPDCVRIEIIGPSQWRSTLLFRQGAGVKRKELKAQSIEYVKSNYGLDVSEDEAESICINDGARIKYSL